MNKLKFKLMASLKSEMDYIKSHRLVEEFSKRFTELVANELLKSRAEAKVQKSYSAISKTLRYFNADECSTKSQVDLFYLAFPKALELIKGDAYFIYQNDPAAKSIEEVVLAYPGFLAIAHYRVANLLHRIGSTILPRMITEYAHSKTGIDIHPSATIGEQFCIDHGTGIVIGETATIGERVKIYQGVTLGALSVSKDLATAKRHPTIESDVVIYAGSTILGGGTVIGHHSVIGGNVWLVKSIPPYSLVYHESKVIVRQNEKQINK